jgi:AcrR family transcriptional regulator
MGRRKTISDDDVLRVARDVFREKGHTATTREVAQAAGISEAVLYQRFGSKHDLFVAAMVPGAPDVEGLLGPPDPPDDAHAYLRAVVARLGGYFAEVIPLALRVMTHPSLDLAAFGRARPPTAAVRLQEGFAERLASLARRKRIVTPSAAVTARLLVSLAHDWGLRHALSPGTAPRRDQELKEMVDVVWQGLQVRGASRSQG